MPFAFIRGNKKKKTEWVVLDRVKTAHSTYSVSSDYSTVGCRRTVCGRTARLEFHLNWRTTPGWKNELRTVSPRANSVCCEDDFFGSIADFETTPLRRRASSHTVCALQANLRDSKTDWKIRTRLAGVVKNKNDPGWDRLPPPFFGTRQYCRGVVE